MGPGTKILGTGTKEQLGRKCFGQATNKYTGKV